MLFRHIVNYLVFTRSPFSADDMRAYKSLEAYNQVIEDWVRDGKVMTTSGLRIVKGKVIRLISLNLFAYLSPSYKILSLRRRKRSMNDVYLAITNLHDFFIVLLYFLLI